MARLATKATKAPRGMNRLVNAFKAGLRELPADDRKTVGKAALAAIRAHMAEKYPSARRAATAAPAARARKSATRSRRKRQEAESLTGVSVISGGADLAA